MNRLRRLCSRVLQPSRLGVAALLCAVALPSLAAPFEIAVSISWLCLFGSSSCDAADVL